jgi:hypothetical protein
VVNPQANSSRTDELVCYLSDAELEEKIAAARNYCALRDEVDLLLSNIGTEPLRTEVMRCVPDWRLLPPSALQPGYELIGEQRVASGRYQQVIRYTEHMAPLQQTLLAWLEERSAHPHHQFIPRPRGRNPSLRT